MAPYIRSTTLKPSNPDLLTTIEKKNASELESIETKLKDAEENLGESEISELLRSKAMYLCRIGNKVRCPMVDEADSLGACYSSSGNGPREDYRSRSSHRPRPGYGSHGLVLLGRSAGHQQHLQGRRVRFCCMLDKLTLD